jgi:hypothetical protein
MTAGVTLIAVALSLAVGAIRERAVTAGAGGSG